MLDKLHLKKPVYFIYFGACITPMAYQYTRIALIVASLIAGMALIISEEYPFGIALLVGGMLLGISYYRNGAIWLIFQKIKNNDYEAAAKLLRKIKDPERLPNNQRGYYYFCCGYLSLQKQDLAQAKVDFELALERGMRLKNDKAVANINLAYISYANSKRSAAKQYLTKARYFEPSKEIQEDIDKLEKQLNG